jgi:hypothetical protein
MVERKSRRGQRDATETEHLAPDLSRSVWHIRNMVRRITNGGLILSRRPSTTAQIRREIAQSGYKTVARRDFRPTNPNPLYATTAPASFRPLPIGR